MTPDEKVKPKSCDNCDSAFQECAAPRALLCLLGESEARAFVTRYSLRCDSWRVVE